MPAVNSVSIPGVRNIMLVLLDSSSQSCQPTVRIEKHHVSVFTFQPNYVPADFTEIWSGIFSNANINALISDLHSALNELCMYMAVGNACGVASSIASELYGVWRPSPYCEYAKESNNYTRTIHGAWAHQTGACSGEYLAEDVGFIEVDNEMTTQVPDDPNSKKKIQGFNFAAMSPLVRFPTRLV